MRMRGCVPVGDGGQGRRGGDELEDGGVWQLQNAESKGGARGDRQRGHATLSVEQQRGRGGCDGGSRVGTEVEAVETRRQQAPLRPRRSTARREVDHHQTAARRGGAAQQAQRAQHRTAAAADRASRECCSSVRAALRKQRVLALFQSPSPAPPSCLSATTHRSFRAGVGLKIQRQHQESALSACRALEG